MVRHIIECSFGHAISFHVADARTAGPFDSLGNVLLDVYHLKNYAPIFMVPHCFDADTQQHTYVSMQLPSVDLLREREVAAKSILADMRDVRDLLYQFIDENAADIAKTLPDFDMRRFEYRFYAADSLGITNEFLPASSMFEDDARANLWMREGNTTVSTHNTFMRGCVKITVRN